MILLDKNKKEICVGDTVKWDDAEGTRTAIVVQDEHKRIGFRCFKNSVPSNWAVGHTFWMNRFMYFDTEHYLTRIEGKDNAQ